ncbi:carbohydrate-binding protein [Dactylosporangium cerinum]
MSALPAGCRRATWPVGCEPAGQGAVRGQRAKRERREAQRVEREEREARGVGASGRAGSSPVGAHRSDAVVGHRSTDRVHARCRRGRTDGRRARRGHRRQPALLQLGGRRRRVPAPPADPDPPISAPSPFVSGPGGSGSAPAPTSAAPTRPASKPPASKKATSPAWAVGVAYRTGAQVTYRGAGYACLQTHTSQVDWSPVAAPALWSRVS